MLKDSLKDWGQYIATHLMYRCWGKVCVLGTLSELGESQVNFKDYLLSENMPDKILRLKANLDKKSCEVIDLCLLRMNNDPLFHGYRPFKEETLVSPKNYLTKEERVDVRQFLHSLPYLRKKYRLPRFEHLPEVFKSHNGLAFLPQEILNYIRGKDFIDGGAYIGDSAIILNEYAPSKIYSFDISTQNAERYRETLLKNHITPERFELVIAGLHEKDQDGTALLQGDIASSIYQKESPPSAFPLMKLDTFRKKRNLQIGFIKLDIEGTEINAIRGATQTLCEDKPVLAIAMYHDPISFFELKPYLESLNLDYELRIRTLRAPGYPGLPISHTNYGLIHMFSLSEVYLLAFPKGLSESHE